MVEGACLPVVLIGRLGRRGIGLVGVLNEDPEAVGHEFGPPAVQCETKLPPVLVEEDGLARPVIDVEERKIFIGELRGGQVDENVECNGRLRISAGDEGRGLPQVAGAELVQ